ncbi:MAG: monovalent cation/H+ antiporter complex subunit F [Chloroflexales bacterium]|nr:monovalent cation/H+ antiporter complex subunit F [Chloroflexales bacterium]
MIINLAQFVVLPLLSIVLVLAIFRLARGPNLPDRVVAIDLIGVLSLSMIATYALITGRSAFLDVALVAALIGFLGVIAFAYYIEKRI